MSGPTKPRVASERVARLVDACQAFRDHADNSKHQFPSSLRDLLHPPYGGASFLANGEEDLRDPWGELFKYE